MASSNLDRFRKDLDDLVAQGGVLELSMMKECSPEATTKFLRKHYGEKAPTVEKSLPAFNTAYEAWYSEAKALIRQLLPDRLSDFVSHYEKPKSRKDITYESYRVSDYLQGLSVTTGYVKEKVVGPDAAIPHYRQQLAILQAVKNRFESSLFDIRQLVQADLFDSELDAAAALLKSRFLRGAGAVAGVVLEKHLNQVCDNHGIKLRKKAPTIADLNDELKSAQVVDTATWRFVQHLGDLRNLCDHDKKVEPTQPQVDDLIKGVSKITKTVF